MTTPIRWFVAHPADQLDLGGLVAYPDEPTARQHAGTTARVLVLVPAEAVDVLTAAADWWHTENLPPSLMDDQEKALARAVNAYELATSTSDDCQFVHDHAGRRTP